MASSFIKKQISVFSMKTSTVRKLLLLLVWLGELLTGPVSQAQWAQLQKLLSPNTSLFGYSVAVENATLVVGARGDGSTGAAYVYERQPDDTWLQVARLTATNGTSGDHFGSSVGVSGSKVVVGCPGKGAVYVFQKPAGGWVDGSSTQVAKLTASDAVASDAVGESVGLSGTTVIAGSNGVNQARGVAYLFEEPHGGWTDATETAKLTTTAGLAEHVLINAVAISKNTIVVGARSKNGGSNAACLFEKPGGGWSTTTETAKLLPSDPSYNDGFGNSVSIAGGTVAVGAPTKAVQLVPNGEYVMGAVYVFEKPDGGWQNLTEVARLLAADEKPMDTFGDKVGVFGNRIIAGAPNHTANDYKGAAYVFEKSVSGWVNGSGSQTAKLTPGDAANYDQFGSSVALTEHYALVGAAPKNQAEGAAYIFSDTCPAILANPITSQRVCQNGDVTFTVTASGVGLTYQWYKGNVSPNNRLNGETNAPLILNAVQPSDEGMYTVEVRNVCGNSVTESASLTIIPLTTIQSLTPSQGTCPGVPFTLSVQATGSNLTYQWYRVVNAALNQPIAGATSASLTLPAPASGSYFVVVSGSCGPAVTSSTVKLTLSPPTVLQVSSLVSSVCEGKSLTLSVRGSGPGTLSYAWTKDSPTGTPLGNASSYTLTNAQVADAGTYYATLTSECTSQTVSIPVTVRYFRITTQPQSVNLCSGSTTLSVAVQAVGVTPTYQWKRNGTNIAGATSASLVVAANRPGSYTVEVKTACATVTSNAATVGCGNGRLAAESVEAPSLIIAPNPVSGGEIRCRVAGPERPEFSLTTATGRSVSLTGKASGEEWVLTPGERLVAGVYLLQASEGPTRLTQRVLVTE
jgi:hypothetical protein